MTCGGGLLYYHYKTAHDDKTEDLVMGEDGTEWHLVKGMQQLYDPENFLEEEQISLSTKNQIPYHFWTASHSRGRNPGVGTAPGDEFVVFKSMRNNKYLSMDS